MWRKVALWGATKCQRLASVGRPLIRRRRVLTAATLPPIDVPMNLKNTWRDFSAMFVIVVSSTFPRSFHALQKERREKSEMNTEMYALLGTRNISH